MQAADLVLGEVEVFQQARLAGGVVDPRAQRAHVEGRRLERLQQAMSSSLGSWVRATMALWGSGAIAVTTSSGMPATSGAPGTSHSAEYSSRGSQTLTA
jgi:hypothetical protein